MSFILDALKKSESDRQRQNGPALFEVKVAPPRTRLPAWAIAIAVLLVVNLGIVMWLLMRHPLRAGTADGSATTAAAPAAGAPAAGSAAAGRATAQAVPGTPPPTALASAASAPAPPLSTAPPPSPARSAPPAASSAPAAPGAVAATAPALPSAPASAPAAEGANPDDYAPAEDAPSPAGEPFSGHVRRGTASGVPLYQDAAATPGTQIPQLRLDLHVFAVRPQDRFVMINMHKVHEGDTTPEGVHVDDITPDGAVLSYNGSRFLLPRQ